MYIEPNTTIKICKDVPLDNTYTNTIYFATKSAQNSYFATKTKYTVTKQSYQRVRRGAMRIEIPADNLYDCNYLLFQNENFGNKWFFAFITGVEYVNNITSEVTFQIDVMQTYFLFDTTLKSCYVQREHVADDTIGKNIIGEGFADLPMIDEVVKANLLSTYSGNGTQFECPLIHLLCVTSYKDSDTYTDPADIWTYGKWVKVNAQMVEGLPQTYTYIPFTNTNRGEAFLNTIVDYYVTDDKKDALIMVFTVPKYALQGVPFIEGLPLLNTLVPPEALHTIGYGAYAIDKTELNISGFGNGMSGAYTSVKNNKLYTYPYRYIEISNNSGQTVDLKFEDFYCKVLDKEFITFDCDASIQPTGCATLIPRSYKEKYTMQPTNNVTERVDYGISSPQFLRGAISIDTYLDWLNQKSWSSITRALGNMNSVMRTGSNTALSYANGNISAQQGFGNIGTIANNAMWSEGEYIGKTIIERYRTQNLPDKTIGAIGNSSILYKEGMFDFTLRVKSVRPEFAKMIDEYFTMYGYAVNELKVPNIINRVHWNYIKTLNCNLVSNAPADDVATIKFIFNKGITFWDSDVGNYDRPNPVITESED